MAVTYVSSGGRVSRRRTEAYICDRFLDMVEKKPFHRITVREFVEYAEISRSTFYVYFDCLDGVVQKLEDDFIEGFYPESIAFAVLLKGNVDQTISQFDYLKQHARTVSLLCGPNGDSRFISRLERNIRSRCDQACDKVGPQVRSDQRDLLTSYVTGGTLFITKRIAEQRGALDEKAVLNLCSTVISANSILLGVRSV